MTRNPQWLRTHTASTINIYNWTTTLLLLFNNSSLLYQKPMRLNQMNTTLITLVLQIPWQNSTFYMYIRLNGTETKSQKYGELGRSDHRMLNRTVQWASTLAHCCFCKCVCVCVRVLQLWIASIAIAERKRNLTHQHLSFLCSPFSVCVCNFRIIHLCLISKTGFCLSADKLFISFESG